AALNLAEHFVEVIDELANLVVGRFFGPDLVAAAVADETGHGDEPFDRPAHDSGGDARQPERHPDRGKHHDTDRDAEPGEAREEVARIRLDRDAADDFAPEHDRTEHIQGPARE